jgi:hypothetical protein
MNELNDDLLRDKVREHTAAIDASHLEVIHRLG